MAEHFAHQQMGSLFQRSGVSTVLMVVVVVVVMVVVVVLLVVVVVVVAERPDFLCQFLLEKLGRMFHLVLQIEGLVDLVHQRVLQLVGRAQRDTGERQDDQAEQSEDQIEPAHQIELSSSFAQFFAHFCDNFSTFLRNFTKILQLSLGKLVLIQAN